MVMDCIRRLLALVYVLLDGNLWTDHLWNQMGTNKSEYDLQLRTMHFDRTFPDMDPHIYYANKHDSGYSQHWLSIQVDILRRDCLDIPQYIYIQCPYILHLLRKDFDCRNLFGLAVFRWLVLVYTARMDHLHNHHCMYKLERDSKRDKLKEKHIFLRFIEKIKYLIEKKSFTKSFKSMENMSENEF